MTADRETSAEPNPSKRPWHKLHLSTWISILFALGFAAIIEIPGELREIKYNNNFSAPEVFAVFDHGWPWRYLERTKPTKLQLTSGSNGPGTIWNAIADEEKEYAGKAPWLVPQAWFFSGRLGISPLKLFLDFLIVVFFLVFVGLSFEWRRRRGLPIWQFTLRELCIVFLLVALGLSWWGVHHRPAMVENEFLSAQICKDYQLKKTKEFAGFRFLCKIFGKSNLSDFEHIQSFEYSLSPCSGMQKTFSYLSRLPYLTSLRIVCYGDYTEEDLAQIAKLKNLEHFSLYVEKNPDAWLKVIREMQSLKSLFFGNYSDSSQGYEGLTKLISLERLVLYNVSLNDNNLSFLSSMKQLRHLTLDCSLVTDNSFEFLGGLKNLETLNIRGTQFTEKGAKKLQALLPNCKILLKGTKDDAE